MQARRGDDRKTDRAARRVPGRGSRARLHRARREDRAARGACRAGLDRTLRDGPLRKATHGARARRDS
ncbi:MAG: hypothetical protein E2O39_06025 [Planctomycetota bacterium]|nr:MAG: hypothetical protein E2O39_06025 [Planctomycetota bacterium]